MNDWQKHTVSDWQQHTAILGCLQRLADAAERIAASLIKIEAIAVSMGLDACKIAENTTPAKTPDPREQERLRVAVSLARATAIYEGQKPSPDGDYSDYGKISDSSLPVRAINCLESDGITTIAELIECSAADLLSLPKFGITSLVQTREFLASIGLHLRGEGNGDARPGTV